MACGGDVPGRVFTHGVSGRFLTFATSMSAAFYTARAGAAMALIMADQPDGKPQRVRESSLQKLRDFLGTFDLRNVVDDQEPKEQVEKARALLEGVSTDALRNMPLIRAHVREGMADLAAQMDVLAGDRVSRKFRFAEE